MRCSVPTTIQRQCLPSSRQQATSIYTDVRNTDGTAYAEGSQPPCGQLLGSDMTQVTKGKAHTHGVILFHLYILFFILRSIYIILFFKIFFFPSFPFFLLLFFPFFSQIRQRTFLEMANECCSKRNNPGHFYHQLPGL